MVPLEWIEIVPIMLGIFAAYLLVINYAENSFDVKIRRIYTRRRRSLSLEDDNTLISHGDPSDVSHFFFWSSAIIAAVVITLFIVAFVLVPAPILPKAEPAKELTTIEMFLHLALAFVEILLIGALHVWRKMTKPTAMEDNDF